MAKRPSPEAIEKNINDAYAIFHNKNFIEAEKAFRIILQKYQSLLRSFERQNITIGLARSLKEQTFEKQKEACSILEELRLDGRFNSFGASTIHNLDLALSRCEEALGRNFEAERRLLRLRRKNRNADENELCKPSRYYDADISNARLWQSMGKHTLAETLLLNIKTELINELQKKLYAHKASKLRKYLDTVNLALGRIWPLMDKHQQSEELLLEMIGKRPDDNEDRLCKHSDRKDIDLALVIVWLDLHKRERAERLLLSVSRKNPHDNEETLCSPIGHPGIDLALVRVWELTEKNKLAEKLLLNMSCKHPNDDEEVLCKPCGHHDTDLTLVRLWEKLYKHERAEKLLLNMSGKHFCASEEELCKPIWNREIDLALVRHWELKGKYKLAEKLLLNMSGKHPVASEEILCKPCWQHAIDLALVRFWEVVGKYHLSERLLLNMIGKQPNNTEEILCEPSGHNDLDLTQVRLWQMMDKPERAERLLLNMSSKSLNVSEESLCKPTGQHDIDLALVCVWAKTGKQKWAERLLRRCRDLYHSNECEYTLLSLFAGQSGFMEMISNYPESANTLLVTSIHYFSLACERIIEEGPKSGNDNLMKALEIVESALEKYPLSAGAYSQKAHCLRMLGRSEQEWREWFNRALSLDPGRAYKVKTDFWRSNETTALQKVLASQVK
ncbi:hypothetical protein [Endozoicomonas sp. 8E]|uniref:hypothetical protein n=1 Tax=Endozoicomonas sp. 8E TaxID=3035692 RepID=UPI0029393A5F|nr:hypothetical protein [Endozoicomonas sp. 8E]WOG26243.1 hypothetical protein P6910_16955 [Endozoicomonas sp. 8E]